MATSTTKPLTYKVAQFHGDGTTRTLQSVLRSAFNKLDSAWSRRQSANAAGKCFRLVNYNSNYKGIQVGELLDYTMGHKQAYTTIDEKASELDLKLMKPLGKQSEFIHSILYFGVFQNHVAIAQAMSLRTRQLEDYLTWLLREAKLLTEDQWITLDDQPDPQSVQKIDGAKGVTMSAPVEFSTGQTGSDRASTSRVLAPEDHTKSFRVKPKGIGCRAIA